MAPQMQNIGLKQVSRLIPNYEGLRLGEDFFLVDVDSGQNLEFMNDPFRADAYFLVYCVNGGLDIEVNLKSYSLSSDMLLISLPGSILRVVTPLNKDSRDGRFLVLAFSKDFLTDICPVFFSKSEARKMMQGGGVSVNKEKTYDHSRIFTENDLVDGRYIVLQRGKKNYYLLIAE